MGAHRNPVRAQESGSVSSLGQGGSQPSSSSAQRRLTPHSGFSRTSQRSLGSAIPTHSEQPRPLARPVPPPKGPSVAALQPGGSSCGFTPSFGSQREANTGSGHNQAALQNKVQEVRKPAFGNSLRILTAVIAGMRHWSQFKDRVPFLVEMFGGALSPATLDSAVTLGQHGAKNFLMRDGKEVVQCVFYENEQALPRLIRGQVHRCVGNYDGRRDVLTCVSVRAGLPSELQSAQAAVKVCDAEMRALLKSFSE
ncbi:unnamed protein product, partial [Tetraodon nigroviridis]